MKIKKKRWILCIIISVCLCTFPDIVRADNQSNQYWPEGPQIVSSAGIVMDAHTGTILYEKNIHNTHYPASITKILTTLLAIENSKMDEIVTFFP